MKDASNKITFTGVNPPNTTTKLIQKHLEKWIDREQSLLFLPRQAHYLVHVDRQEYRYYTCQIEIQIGAKEWSAIGEGRSLQESVLTALRRLKPKPKVEVYRPSPLPAQFQATA